MITVDAGSAIVMEITTSKYSPFGSYSIQDPDDNPVVNVFDNKGNQVVTDQSSSKSATGKYYYVIQTLTTWKKGVYKAIATADFSPNQDVKVDNRSFRVE